MDQIQFVDSSFNDISNFFNLENVKNIMVCKNLLSLNLQNNKIQSFDLNLNLLIVLNLNHNFLVEVFYLFQVPNLINFPKISRIFITDNKIEILNMEKITPAKKTLEGLDLSHK